MVKILKSFFYKNQNKISIKFFCQVSMNLMKKKGEWLFSKSSFILLE